MRTNCIPRRPDINTGRQSKETDTVNSNGVSKPIEQVSQKREKDEKVPKVMLRTARMTRGIYGYSDPTIRGCLGGGINKLKANIKRIFDYDNDKELELIAQEMQNRVLWESESLIRKILSGLLK